METQENLFFCIVMELKHINKWHRMKLNHSKKKSKKQLDKKFAVLSKNLHSFFTNDKRHIVVM